MGNYFSFFIRVFYFCNFVLQALRAKRTVEQQYEESVSRINELTTINVNIASSKAKIEQELGALAGDYEEVTKELRVSDERYQRVQNELKHTVEILHEEQERIVKIEAIKKSLEIEVKNVSIRLEEVEANAIVGGKRIISKLEARVRLILIIAFISHQYRDFFFPIKSYRPCASLTMIDYFPIITTISHQYRGFTRYIIYREAY